MTSRSAIVQTGNASRYLQQLCKHFGHKVPVEFTPQTGTVTLPFGTCQLLAEPDTLTMTITGEDAQIGRLERFIGDHLARFAFRETPEIRWQASA